MGPTKEKKEKSREPEKKKRTTKAGKQEKGGEPLLRFDQVGKKFPSGTVALAEVSFSVSPGEFLFVVGRSGAGKTTLLKVLRRELSITEGEIYLQEWKLSRIPSSKIPLLRRRIATIYQDYKLLTEMTVWENVLVALEIVRCPREEMIKRAEAVLRQMGIWENRDYFPAQLSGGESQRTAIARALVIEPDIILADEPTADLDPGTTWEIVNLLKEINQAGTTVVVATHDFDIVDSLGKRVITLERGKVVSDQAEGEYERGD